MQKILRLSKSDISKKELRYVSQILNKEYLGMGPETYKFERELESFFNRKVLCSSSGTSALHLALQACGVKIGDEVIAPTITYVATYQAITATGAKVVFCDVEQDTLCISIKDLKKKITSRTKVIVPVHIGGHPCDLEQIYKIAKKNKLRVIEDSAHAFGSFYHKKKIGSFGDISCFSFDGVKNITSGEGGCIVTNDKKILKKINDARVLGVEGESKKKYLKSRSWDFDVKEQGWRYHLSDLNAAIGRAQLKRFKKFSSIRQNLAKQYDKIIKKNDYKKKEIEIFKRDYTKEVPHIYYVLIKKLKFRDELRHDLLEKNKIQTGIHYFPGYKLSYFKKKNFFSNTEKIYKKILTLPLHTNLKKQDVNYIIKSLFYLLKSQKYY